jgi:succinate dehydrogenase/fumarate reductase flavoprotein subunit
MREKIAKIMNKSLGIVRNEAKLIQGIEEIEKNIDICNGTSLENNLDYASFSTKTLLILAKAILVSALNRKETRGSHIRSDYPNKSDQFNSPSYIKYNGGNYEITYKEE